MKELKGYSISPGIASGTVCVYAQELNQTSPHYKISKKQVSNEIKRISNAFKDAEKSMEEMKKLSKKLFGKQGEEIISAHLAILNDQNLRRKIEGEILKNRINAEHAILDAFEDYIGRFTQKGAHFEELTHDMKDVRDRLLQTLGTIGGSFVCPIGEKEPVIVASERLTPSMVFNIPRENALSFVTHQGGFTSHASILARTLNIPVIFGIDVKKELACKCQAIVDGSLGKVIVDPDKKTVDYYEQQKEIQEERKEYCKKKLNQLSQTDFGEKIALKLNVSLPGELELLPKDFLKQEFPKNLSFEGIGLLRTEFMFLQRNEPPDEETQFMSYKNIIERTSGKTVVARMLDISRDKIPSYIDLPPGTNLDMDLRGARSVLAYKDIYLTQVKAMLRAAVLGDLKILFPMVSDVEDILSYKEIITQAEHILQKEKKDYKKPPVGAMLETPSSAVLTDFILKEVDFANIGTNDLLQYSLAASRDNLISQERYHILHPSVVKMLQMMVEAGKKENKEVCLCGEIASFESFYPILLDAGVRSFSVPVGKFEDIKCELLNLDSSVFKGMYQKYLKKRTHQFQEQFFKSWRQ